MTALENHFPSFSCVQKMIFSIALFCAMLLLVTGFSKLVYPEGDLKILDQGIGGFELLVAAVLFFGRKYRSVWYAAILLFSAWGGYALFWFFLKLPCKCMGSLFAMPTVVSMTLDLFCVALSIIAAFLQGAFAKYLYLAQLFGVLMALAGYATADWIYRTLILGL